MSQGSFTRTWSLLSGGQLAQLVIGFAASVVIARKLGPGTFGVYALLGSIAAVIGAVCDFGITSVGVRRIASEWPERPAETGERLIEFAALRLLAALAVVGASVALAGWIVHRFGTPGMTPRLLHLTLLGVLATTVCGTVQSALQATRSFTRLSAGALVNPALTLVLALWLRARGQLTIEAALVVLGILPALVATLTSLWLVPGAVRRAVAAALDRLERARLWAAGQLIVRRASPLGVTYVLGLVGTYADLWVVGKVAAGPAIGFYALALNLTRKIGLVARSMHTLMLPNIARLQGDPALLPYVKKALLRAGALALIVIAALPLAPWLIRLVYGSPYAAAAPYLFGLAAVALLELLTAPLGVVLESSGAVRILLVAESLRVAGIVVPALIFRRAATVGDIVGWKVVTTAAVAVLLAVAAASRLRPRGAERSA